MDPLQVPVSRADGASRHAPLAITRTCTSMDTGMTSVAGCAPGSGALSSGCPRREPLGTEVMTAAARRPIIRSVMRVAFVSMAIWWAVACSAGPERPATSEPAAAPATPTAPPTSEPAATAPPSATAPVVTAASAAPAPEPLPGSLSGSDYRSAAACEDDADCGFDDPCMPQRCVASRSFGAQKCSESRPPPGACTCLEGRCTLEPREQPKPDGPCEVRGCVVDRAGGRCVADTRGVADNFRTNGGLSIGPSCDCIEPAKGCRFSWHAPVPCRTERDCWIDELPRPHPVPRPRHLRGRDFRPCQDGETAPQCGPDGHCVLGPAFGC